MQRRACTTRLPLALAALPLLLCSVPAAAQSIPRKAFDDVRHALGDMFWVYTSPLHADRGDLATLGLIATGTGLAAIYDDELDAWILRNPESAPMKLIDPFREDHGWQLYDLGSSSLLVRTGGVLWIAGLLTGWDDLRDAGIGCAAAEQAQTYVRHGVYQLLARRRPLGAEGDPYIFSLPGGDWIDHSFFGGHGANIVTCAAFFAERFELGLIEPVILGIAAGITLGRVADRAHWLSDAVVGTAVGYAFGKAFADRQLARRRDRGRETETNGRLSGLYFDYGRLGGLVLGWRRAF